jgi:hypothetical protein
VGVEPPRAKVERGEGGGGGPEWLRRRCTEFFCFLLCFCVLNPRAERTTPGRAERGWSGARVEQVEPPPPRAKVESGVEAEVVGRTG